MECSISDTDLFTPAFVQSDIESGIFEDIYPVTNLDDGGSTEFVLRINSSKILDLAISYLKLKCKIIKAYETNIVAIDGATLTNYPMASLFSQVDVLLDGKVISSSTKNYAFHAYLAKFTKFTHAYFSKLWK